MSLYRLGGVLVLLAMALTACGDGDGLCARLPGTEFQSEEFISAVETEDGVVASPEFVSFSDDNAEWIYSDVAEFDEYECSGDRVSFLDDRFVADVLDEDGSLVLDRDGTRYLQR